MALRRDGARVGDEVWVSGTPGDAAGALAQWQAGGAIDPVLRARLDRPTPRVSLGRALRGIATSCIDVSDGLLADLGHVCKASAVGMRVDVAALPASQALRHRFDAEARRVLQATGGDDYELCFTAPAERHAAVLDAASTYVPVTCIGRVGDGAVVSAVDADGDAWRPPVAGYRHFD
jgi:thiamine-monophosphate kinase